MQMKEVLGSSEKAIFISFSPQVFVSLSGQTNAVLKPPFPCFKIRGKESLTGGYKTPLIFNVLFFADLLAKYSKQSLLLFPSMPLNCVTDVKSESHLSRFSLFFFGGNHFSWYCGAPAF